MVPRMAQVGQQVVEAFDANMASVRRLACFDEELLDVVLVALRNLDERLAKRSDNPNHRATKTITLVERIRENDSLSPRYAELLNQCVVLQVSYFTSAMADLVRAFVPILITKGTPRSLLNEELKLTVADLQSINADLPDFLMRKNNFSFQDMKTTNEALTRLLGVNPPRQGDPVVNNIIVGQACRHAIVHAASLVDQRLLHQVRDASPRNVLTDLHLGQKIRVTNETIDILAQSMSEFINRILAQLPSAEQRTT